MILHPRDDVARRSSRTISSLAEGRDEWYWVRICLFKLFVFIGGVSAECFRL